MTEVEIKAKVSDHAKCIDKIKSLGGKFSQEENQIDINFGRPQDLDDNHMLIDGSFVGRIRSDEKGTRVELKEVKRGGGAREFSSPVNKIADGEYLFDYLGFNKAFSIEKHRTKYILDDFEISLDKVKKLGNFIEIEHSSKDGENVESLLNECKKLLKQIDPKAEIEHRKYGDLMQNLINRS